MFYVKICAFYFVWHFYGFPTTSWVGGAWGSQIMTHGCRINPTLSILQINSIWPALMSGGKILNRRDFKNEKQPICWLDLNRHRSDELYLWTDVNHEKNKLFCWSGCSWVVSKLTMHNGCHVASAGSCCWIKNSNFEIGSLTRFSKSESKFDLKGSEQAVT